MWHPLENPCSTDYFRCYLESNTGTPNRVAGDAAHMTFPRGIGPG